MVSDCIHYIVGCSIMAENSFVNSCRCIIAHCQPWCVLVLQRYRALYLWVMDVESNFVFLGFSIYLLAFFSSIQAES